MKFEEMTITPDMARGYLELNRVNRTLNKGRAKQYAEDIKAGKWELNGEAIKFYDDGSLADGQHRLAGIIIADTPIRTVVITELPKEIAVQDRGRNRSVADVMQLKGMQKDIANNRTIAMAKLHYSVQKNITNVSDGMVERFIEKNEDLIRELVNMSKSYAKGSSKGVNVDAAVIKLPCFYAVNSGECSKDQIRLFLKVLKTGIPNALNQSAALVCRNDIISGAISTRGSTENRKIAVFQIEKAIQDFITGYPRKKSYVKCTEPIYANHVNNQED